MKKTSWLEIFKTPFPYLCFCFLFATAVLSKSTRGSIAINIGDESIVLETENDQVKFEDILKDIPVGTPKEDYFLSVLKQRDIYKISNRNYSLVNALKKLDFSGELSQGIRNLWKDSKGPFSYQTSMKIVVDTNLSGNDAKVCRNSFLAEDQKLIVISNNRKRMTTVNVNKIDPLCDVNEEENKNNLRVSTDIIENLKTEDIDKFPDDVKVDVLFDNPRNAPTL